jgi:histidinol phosphatase-like enzyme
VNPVICILEPESIVKAVFVKQDCLLEAAPATAPAEPGTMLRSGVAAGLSALAEHKLFIIVLDVGSCSVVPASVAAGKSAIRAMLDAMRAAGGHVDALMQCLHEPGSGCGCWGTNPGFLYAAAARLDLRLDECYLLCDQASDVLLAYRAQCRPMLILEGRGIGDLYDGHQPEPSDFPIARDFSAAVQYVLTEEDGNKEWGHVRQPAPRPQLEEVASIGNIPEFSPTLELFSPVPGVKGFFLYGLPQVSSGARKWLAAFVVGAVGLSLGIAYMLTDLYRRHPFPAFVYYLTLQFIPRSVRGLLFILGGVAIVAISLRAILRSPSGTPRRK